MSPTPEQAWCSIELASGTTLRTNSFEDSPEGSRFLSLHAPDSTPLGWWATETVASSQDASELLTTLAHAARAEERWDDEYDVELHLALPAGALRICPDGTYIRVVTADGAELDGGSAYWTADEIAENPGEVLGAVLGAAHSLT